MTDENKNFNQFPSSVDNQKLNVEHSDILQSLTSTIDNDDKNADKKKIAKKSKDDLGELKIVDSPIRKLPNLINEVLDKNFSVILTKNGYYINGFYGLNQESGKKGYAFSQETTDQNVLVFFDSKGHKHLIKSFEDLVNFNNHVWGIFFKLSEEYKKPDPAWFSYMLDLGVLNITPGGK